MTSPLLALFTLSVRADTRAKSTYWARAGLAAFMLAVMGTTALAQLVGGAPGLIFMQNSLWLQTVFLTITGLGWFASAITEEKEEDTLGLLRMTNLSPLSILLGKGTSRLGGALLLIGAQVPFTLLAVTLGGVSAGQVFAAYATLGAYAFLLGNLALLASVIAPRTGLAALGTAAVLALGVLGGKSVPALAAISPLERLETIFTTGFQESPVGAQVVGSVGLGLLFFFLAWALFEPLCEGRLGPWGAPGKLARRKGRRWLAPGRPKITGADIWDDALAWKDFHFLHGGWRMVFVKAVGCTLLVTSVLIGKVSRGENLSAEVFPFQLFFLGVVWLLAEAGFAAARICSSEVRGQTLSSLALLPQSLPVTMKAKAAGCWPALLPVFGLLALSLVSAFFVAMFGNNQDPGGIIFGVGVGSAYLLAISYFGVHLTVYLSLRMKRGALPLAVIICIAWGVFTIIPVLGWFGVPLVAVIVGQRLRDRIFNRLEELAAEG